MGGKRAGDRSESYLRFHTLAVKVSKLETEQVSRRVGGVFKVHAVSTCFAAQAKSWWKRRGCRCSPGERLMMEDSKEVVDSEIQGMNLVT